MFLKSSNTDAIILKRFQKSSEMTPEKKFWGGGANSVRVPTVSEAKKFLGTRPLGLAQNAITLKDRDTIFYMRGPWESEQKPKRQKEVWGTPLEKYDTRLLKLT